MNVNPSRGFIQSLIFSEVTIQAKEGGTVKEIKGSILILGMVVLLAVPSNQAGEYVWTDRGCESEYIMDDIIIVYFAPDNGVEFELWAYDAVMAEELLSEGVGDGNTLSVTVTAGPPPGPLTFVLKMPCATGCELCDLCDYGQCTVYVAHACQDHCTNGVQDCGEYGVDCGGGCPVTDSDQDGVEDCMDACPNSQCDNVDSTGCETDVDADGVTDCEDDCPDEKGDPSNRGCPSTNVFLILGGVGVVVAVGGLALWRMRRKPSS